MPPAGLMYSTVWHKAFPVVIDTAERAKLKPDAKEQRSIEKFNAVLTSYFLTIDLVLFEIETLIDYISATNTIFLGK